MQQGRSTTAACWMALFLLIASVACCHAETYAVSDARGPGRVLDGIGGLSGGGATSVLLWTYPEPQRSAILDFLFKPNFGASLHILKVEIGGDAQSTDGAEPSHMHTPWDENYQRGYEWWLMVEAKKRNPNIKLYGLAWAYPQWVTCTPDTMDNCTNDIYTFPEVTATYIVKWIAGAKNTYGLDIDYVGCWNERPYNDTYLKTLRRVLDASGFNGTKIVAPDGSWDLANDILADPELAKAVYGIGAHYPGTVTTNPAEQTGKPLWASEDDSTYNNDVGAGCWARILNQNYVNGNMTATINWNLIAAYQKGTNWYRAGLMSAMQPWGGGSYGSWRADGTWTVGPMMWATAHTTQFSEPGTYAYLRHGDGAGLLSQGGSYVTLKNFETGDFTIVIEKMSHDHSFCVRPYLAPFNTSDEVVTLELGGALANATVLHLWYTHWAYYPTDAPTTEFLSLGPVSVVDGRVTLNVTVNSMYTLTTLATGHKGTPPTMPPQPTLFPEVHVDSFDQCRISGEAQYFSDQNGIFECVAAPGAASGQNVVMQQMVPMRPVTWGGDIRPHSLVGHRDAKNTSLSIDGYLTEPDGSMLLGVRAQGTDNSAGILVSLDNTSRWCVWDSMQAVGGSSPVACGAAPQSIVAGQWYRIRIDVNGTALNAWLDGFPMIQNMDVLGLTASGFALIGTMAYGQYTQYDNLQLYSAYSTRPLSATAVAVAGDPICVVECNSEVGLVPTSQWTFTAVPNAVGSASVIALRNQPDLCITAMGGPDTEAWWLTLQPCRTPSNPLQMWTWAFGGIAPDSERQTFIYLSNASNGNNVCLDIYNQVPEIGAQMDAWPCNLGANQAFFYDYDANEVANEATATCLGVCR